MTTIAYNRGVLAVDKQANDGDLISKAGCKLVHGEDFVYAIAGTLYKGIRFAQWKETGMEEDPPSLKGCTVVRMDLQTGNCTLYEGTTYGIPVDDPMYAWGTGSHIAVGAMAVGASPEEAVLIAGKWDRNTGLGVQVVYSEKARKRLGKGRNKAS